jgi:hypothetical protein
MPLDGSICTPALRLKKYTCSHIKPCQGSHFRINFLYILFAEMQIKLVSTVVVLRISFGFCAVMLGLLRKRKKERNTRDPRHLLLREKLVVSVASSSSCCCFGMDNPGRCFIGFPFLPACLVWWSHILPPACVWDCCCTQTDVGWSFNVSLSIMRRSILHLEGDQQVHHQTKDLSPLLSISICLDVFCCFYGVALRLGWSGQCNKIESCRER